ncbi:hypothetical protein MMAD_35600 [Mycolicibacterium madagascariense]|uniref:DUF732 domain-containing protein n=1 Tax=Mycolicibacterium madagascariense TaxID=212765 RepID=A0A7I7XJH7_9MYCO|nr:hypothetical protein MMAD_35600 [Mycolicibacterium madagascariense]
MVLALGMALGVAPSASASEASYVDRLESQFPFLTPAQLLPEGHKVCRFVSAGRPVGDAIPMIVKDLAVTVAVAFEISAAAAEELGC